MENEKSWAQMDERERGLLRVYTSMMNYEFEEFNEQQRDWFYRVADLISRLDLEQSNVPTEERQSKKFLTYLAESDIQQLELK